MILRGLLISILSCRKTKLSWILTDTLKVVYVCVNMLLFPYLLPILMGTGIMCGLLKGGSLCLSHLFLIFNTIIFQNRYRQCLPHAQKYNYIHLLLKT